MLINRKKLLAILLGIMGLVIIGGFFAFEASVKWVETRLEMATVGLRQKGFDISYSQVFIKGNPLLLQVVFENPTVADAQGLWRWQGHQLIVAVYPWKPTYLTCTFPGDQKLSLSQKLPFPLGILSFEGLKVTLSLSEEGHLTTADVMADTVTSDAAVSLKSLSLEARDLEDLLSLHFALRMEVFHMETLLKEDPLNDPLTVKLAGEMSGYAQKTFPQSLSQWRDGGGVLEVTSLKLSWPPIQVEGEGTLTLDKNMYPLGSFSSRIVGYQDALANMVKLGWIKPKKAAMASFILDLLTTRDTSGNKSLTVPITLQNGEVSVGPAPLLKLQPLENF